MPTRQNNVSWITFSLDLSSKKIKIKERGNATQQQESGKGRETVPDFHICSRGSVVDLAQDSTPVACTEGGQTALYSDFAV